MRRLMLCGALMGAIFVLAGAATPSIPTVVVGIGQGHRLGSSEILTIEPTSATPTGDGTLWWEHLHWWTWGGATAVATGGLSADNCNPNCAQGHFTHYAPGTAHARLVASVPKVMRCDHRTVKAYTRYVFSARQVSRGLKVSWHMHVSPDCQLRFDS